MTLTKVKVIGQKAGICDGVPSTSALVIILLSYFKQSGKVPRAITQSRNTQTALFHIADSLF